MNIIQFIESGIGNAWIKEPEFSGLYVRHTWRLINSERIKTLDIANVTSKKPGRGSFGRLLEKIRSAYPELCIYVECVHNDKFCGWLLRNGFKQVENLYPPCFFHLPTKVKP